MIQVSYAELQLVGAVVGLALVSFVSGVVAGYFAKAPRG